MPSTIIFDKATFVYIYVQRIYMSIYLDHNGTTPMCQEVCDEISTFLKFNYGFPQCFGNASSSYCFGFEAKQKLENSRAKVAELLNAERSYVVFTSGGTESNNMVIIGLASQHPGMTIISGPCEHPSVYEPIRVAKRLFDIRHKVVPCLKTGTLDLEFLKYALATDVFLVVTMLAQNEIGSVSDDVQLVSIIREFNESAGANIKLHLDACYAVGKIPVSFRSDFMSLAGHKLYGPKGIGCLLYREALPKVFDGAGQERERRPGTENIMLIAGLARACELAREQMSGRIRSAARKTALMYSIFKYKSLDFVVNGAAGRLLDSGVFEEHFAQATAGTSLFCLPNTLSASFKNVPGSSVIAALAQSVCVSAGAACHSDRVDISETLRAIGLDVRYAAGTIRISCGEFVTEEQCADAAERIADTVKQYQGALGGPLDQMLSAASAANDPHNGAPKVHLPSHKTGETAQQIEYQAQDASDYASNLLSLTSGLGCACKLRPQALNRILGSLDFGSDAYAIINQNNSEDAAVVRFDAPLLVFTTDFFSPVIDSPYLYGAIAAANALSDIYAMNGSPRAAVAIAGFPSARLSEDSTREIMRGAIDKCAEAGITISGGHTIEAIEPFFGLAVCGAVSDQKTLKRNAIDPELCENDVYLVLSKKIGAGILTTALKRGLLQNREDYAEIYRDLVSAMAELNVPREVDSSVIALTDVTGFGLAGHLCEMIGPGQLSAEIHVQELPIMTGAREICETYGSAVVNSYNNIEYAKGLGYDLPREETFTDIIADPNTSGGLLFAVKGWQNAQRVAEANRAAIIGHVYRSELHREILLSHDAARELCSRALGIFK